MATMVETFRARREVNLGWCKRQNGDFIPEYTKDDEIEPRARERLIRLGYIERRTVSQDELDAWWASWREKNASEAEGSADEDGETSEEETPDFEEGADENEVPVISVVEESIEDLGPAEDVEEDADASSAGKKKVVRTPRNNKRRS